MMNYKILGVFMLALGILAGCSQKTAPEPILAWSKYQDPYFKVQFTYPKDWKVTSDGAKVTITSSEASVQKFFDPTSGNPDGSQLTISYNRLDTVDTVEKMAQDCQKDLKGENYTVDAVEQTTLEDVPASKVSYNGAYDAKTKFAAVRLFAVKDSVLYTATYSGFNEYFAAHKAVLDSFIASAKLPRPKTAAEIADPSLPSPDFVKMSNDFLELIHPDNYSLKLPEAKKDVKFAMQIVGYRVDTYIQIDVREAQKLTVDKLFEQNSKSFKATSKGETTIDGQKALYINYSSVKGVDSRVYFVVKNDKFYRVILNFFSEKKNNYLPAFEKVVASIKIK
ncbi:MAG: hypothetical protein V1799_16085 [bacterium]